MGWATGLLTLTLFAGTALVSQAQPGSPSHWRAHRPLIVRGMLIGPPRPGAPFIQFPIPNARKSNKGKGGGGGTSSSSIVYYGPQSIWYAYNYPFTTSSIGSSNDGSGQTIAIVDAYSDPSIFTDLSAFDSHFGLPDPPSFAILQPEGTPAPNSNWATEQSLDVEWAHAMAPGANIVLVEATSSSLSNLLNAVAAAVKSGASVVSMSWGGSEFSSESYYDSFFSASGVSFVASSGDSHGVFWPAASPDVIGVGGTTLDMSGNSVTSETAWSDSGGGFSSYEAEPSWQVSFAATPDGGSLTKDRKHTRGVPDVSYDANPNTGLLIVYNGTWYVVGGTSCGAPQWAAIIALANQKLASTTVGGSAGSDLYGLATNGYSTYFRDILNSGTGYDLYTGLGSPNVNHLISGL